MIMNRWLQVCTLVLWFCVVLSPAQRYLHGRNLKNTKPSSNKPGGNTGTGGSKPGGNTGTGGSKTGGSTPTGGGSGGGGGGSGNKAGGGGGTVVVSNNSCGFTNRDDYTTPGQAPPGLVENYPCLPFSNPAVQAAATNPYRTGYKNYDQRCDTNNCPCGCCRYFTYQMRCDYDNLFPQLPVSTGNFCEVSLLMSSL